MWEASSTAGDAETGAWRSPARFLCVAAILHLALSITIYELGRHEIFPAAFDANGVAVAFASDGVRYRADAAALSETLKRGELRSWVVADRPFHVKLYSICFALFGSWLGYTVVGAEPLNILFYLVILILLFRLGREVFNRRAGLLSAGAVALWLSFVLHTTQFLKDPPFVAGTLALVLIIMYLLTRNYSRSGALLTGAAGGLIATALWLTRADMGAMLVATVLLGALMLVARQLRERRVLVANMAGLALLIAATVCVPLVMPDALELGRSPSSVRASAERDARRRAAHEDGALTTQQGATPTHLWSRAAMHVADVRRRFIELYADAGSNIDTDVQLNDAADLVRYLPRAAAVGFFAPFPDMWLVAGRQVGATGRLLGGLECLAMYAVEGLALVGLWLERRRLAAWFLFSVAATGMIALGLVVVNVGTLYRLRYVFLMFLIILAAEGASRSLKQLSKKLRETRGRGATG